MTAAILSRLGRMPLNEALALSHEQAMEWIEDLAEAEKLLTPKT